MNVQFPKVYLARAGGKGEDEVYALDHSVAVIGFREYPSLIGAKDYEAILRIVKEARPNLKPRTAANHAGQLWAFSFAMQPGDTVVLPRKLTSQVALGRIAGSYEYKKVEGNFRHTRAVDWTRPDVARSVFRQDLLYSFGAFQTVYQITRNGAEQRVAEVLAGKADPGVALALKKSANSDVIPVEAEGTLLDLAQAGHDQIVAHIQSRFGGHKLARLVASVLAIDGWVTKLSTPSADGGVDIFAGRGSLGLDQPRLWVQVKSQASPIDVTVYRTLQTSMQTFNAEQGLLVAWGGFNNAVHVEAKRGDFPIRLWESRDLVEAIYRNYERLPAEIRADLPLKPVWMLVDEGPDE